MKEVVDLIEVTKKKRRFRNAPLVMYFGILQGGQLYHRWEGVGEYK